MTHGEDCSARRSCCTGPRPGTTSDGIELGERLEREHPLVQARMRELEAGLVDREPVHQQEVEVDGSRAVPRPRAHPPELPLDLEQRREEGRRSQRGIDRDRCIEKSRLVEKPHGIGLPERRHRDDVDLRTLVEELDRACQRRRPVTEVRSEPYVGTTHNPTLNATCPSGAPDCTYNSRQCASRPQSRWQRSQLSWRSRPPQTPVPRRPRRSSSCIPRRAAPAPSSSPAPAAARRTGARALRPSDHSRRARRSRPAGARGHPLHRPEPARRHRRDRRLLRPARADRVVAHRRSASTRSRPRPPDGP